MYAIIETGGKQYRVNPGETVKVEKIEGQVGDQVTFDQILFVGETGEDQPNEPASAHVTATIVEQGKADKVLVFKFKRRKMYRRLRGHRQRYTAVKIEGIELGAAKSE